MQVFFFIFTIHLAYLCQQILHYNYKNRILMIGKLKLGDIYHFEQGNGGPQVFDNKIKIEFK